MLTENDKILTRKQAVHSLADTITSGLFFAMPGINDLINVLPKGIKAALSLGIEKRFEEAESDEATWTNEMLSNLGGASLRKLLEIFNLSWEQGTLQQIRREAILMPILKKAKAPKKPSSYRPISLTSCVVES